MSEIVPTKARRYRREVPEAHRASLDTRLQWMWNQRFGTIQMIWKESSDVLDHTAATLILQSIMGKDLNSIQMLLNRLEGGAITDKEILDKEPKMRI